MKKLLFIPLAFTLSFCKCPQNSVSKTQVTTIESVCPENGKCSIQIFKNKSLDVKEDEFGSIYYAITDNTSTSVILYEYKRNVEEGLQDGQHREEIVFEINNTDKEIHLNDFALQNTKMLFGRHCFCRGQAGFYKVSEGKLNLENNDNTITLDLDFTITKVPQLYSKVKATIK
jgi:hypothetical protein